MSAKARQDREKPEDFTVDFLWRGFLTQHDAIRDCIHGQ